MKFHNADTLSFTEVPDYQIASITEFQKTNVTRLYGGSRAPRRIIESGEWYIITKSEDWHKAGGTQKEYINQRNHVLELGGEIIDR